MMRRAGSVLAAACFAAATKVDCSSCDGAEAGPDGSLRCHCDIVLDTFGFDERGRLNVTTQECSQTLTFGGTFNGEHLERRDALVEDIFLEKAFFCEGNVSIRMRDVFFSEAGVHFCPHIKICDEIDINNDKDWCVTIHPKESCLQHRSCSECTLFSGCAWCNATSTCLQRHASKPTRDHCEVCLEDLVLPNEMRPDGEPPLPADTCPSTTDSKVPRQKCESVHEAHNCTSGLCKWRLEKDRCEPLLPDEIPTGPGVTFPEIIWPDLDGDDDTWGVPQPAGPAAPSGQVGFPKPSRVMPKEVGRSKFEEHRPKPEKDLSMVMTLLGVSFCVAFMLAGVMARRMIMSRAYAADGKRTAPAPSFAGSLSDRGDVDTVSVVESRCELAEYVEAIPDRADPNNVEY